ncbi:Hypothetical predicted protein [Pelobates cultripes]|uniref:Uncharacterized protein n=1 Tax=Pelobates cultripes TaxID=61616 RepID=A0AAD1VQ57_PELCU|nr:Hypothetical predicted protein [Pelobates cultripes]
MEYSISVSATDMMAVCPRDSPINVRRLHKRAFLVVDLSSSSSEEDTVPVSKRTKKACLSSSSSEDELDFGPSSPHSHLSSRCFKGTVPPKAKHVFPLFEVSKQFSHKRDKICLSAVSPSPSTSRAFAHSSSLSRSCSRQVSPEIDWEWFALQLPLNKGSSATFR